jgi:hypothetical protein
MISMQLPRQNRSYGAAMPGDTMPITRRRALMTGGAGALAALLPPLPLRAQETDPVRTLTRAYNASGQQLSGDRPRRRQFGVLALFDRYCLAMALAGPAARPSGRCSKFLQHRLTRPEIDRANAQALAAQRLRPVRRHADLSAGPQLAGKRCEKPWIEAEGCQFPARREGETCVVARRSRRRRPSSPLLMP